MVRPRKKGMKDLPLNLYDNKGYFYYRHPVTGKSIFLGRDREESIVAAHDANVLLIKKTNLIDKITGKADSFSKFLDYFDTEILPKLKFAKKTVQGYREKIPHIRNALGKISTNEISVKATSDFLDSFPDVQSNRYRSLLILIFKHAVAKGRADNNPAYETIRKIEDVKRKRLSSEGYKVIWDNATPEIRNAMDFALQTLQRREEIANAKFEDIKEDCLYIQQKKTGMPIKILITAPVYKVINSCRDIVASKFIIHQGIKANRLRRSKKMTPESLTKGFARARNKSGYYNNLKPLERPSFHEIRALGADLYRDAGWSESEIQKLLGHTSEKMTQLYLDRHKIRWIEANCGLDLDKQ